MITWASRIRDLQDAGLTLAEIALQAGVAPSTIGDLATGRTDSPRGETALKLDQLHRDKCRSRRSRSNGSARRATNLA